VGINLDPVGNFVVVDVSDEGAVVLVDELGGFDGLTATIDD